MNPEKKRFRIQPLRKTTLTLYNSHLTFFLRRKSLYNCYIDCILTLVHILQNKNTILNFYIHNGSDHIFKTGSGFDLIWNWNKKNIKIGQNTTNHLFLFTLNKNMFKTNVEREEYYQNWVHFTIRVSDPLCKSHGSCGNTGKSVDVYTFHFHPNLKAWSFSGRVSDPRLWLAGSRLDQCNNKKNYPGSGSNRNYIRIRPDNGDKTIKKVFK